MLTLPNDPDLAPWPPGWSARGSLMLHGAAATDDLAALLAVAVTPGDTLLLQGNLGAGKSHLARALIRARLGDATAEVPSPTFTLVQTYDAAGIEIRHADLYRLSDPRELDELGVTDDPEEAICLIEWPDRIAPNWPDDAVCLRLDTPPDDPESRRLTLVAPAGSTFAARLWPVIAP